MSLEQFNTFQLNHLDIDTLNSSENTDTQVNFFNETTSESVILNDLSKQVEELQSKLKLSYRRLFLFETENQKLLKEKNYFFYEKTNLEEQSKINSEKLEQLTLENKKYASQLTLLNEKITIQKDLLDTQSHDLKRMNKFYDKIKNIIKPYVQNLKNTLENQIRENEKLSKINHQYLELSEALNKKLSNEIESSEINLKKFEFEKNNLIQSYEEQIHSLSKDILEFQQRISFSESEILRLKKANETKNYLENELIRFKRTHSEDQEKINSLSLKLNEINDMNQSLNYKNTELNSLNVQNKTDLENLNTRLTATQNQLSKQLDKNEQLELRLAMLEKLNIHLSENIKTQNFEVHQIKS